MKKNSRNMPKKLELSRETLVHLETEQLREVAGKATLSCNPWTHCNCFTTSADC